jgi:RNA:NAD 2'-phosphotransferase (TPT1/KptA family)
MILNKLDIRSSPTFYKNQKDLDIALTTTVEILNSASNYLSKDSDGFFPLSYIISTLKDKIPSLFYINRNHIIEFYFKDLVRKISFKREDYIKYETNTPVQSSEILHIGKPTSTLYFNQSDLNASLISTVHLLRDNIANLNKSEDGYYKVDEVCDTIKKRMPFLSYMDKNFVVELFFKDIQRKIIFKDSNLIKYKLKLYIKPPDILYFGTLTNLALKMKDRGIYSNTKRYVKLYSSREGAENFAKKFASNKDDKISVLVVDAKQAYIKGLKFSTYEDGEYIISEVEKEYIKEIL